MSDNTETAIQERQEWNKIIKAETAADSIIPFRCNKTKPTIELNFKVKVV